MTRFAWLQARTQTLVVTATLAALAAVAVVTGLHMAHLYDSTVAPCQNSSSTSCDFAVNRLMSHFQFLDHTFDLLTLAAPALFGIFWGAPLLTRELETGTFRLAWTQSVTRSRWLLSKLGVVAAATATVAGLLTLTVTWWYHYRDKFGTNQYAVFDRRDLAPLGYAVFAFAAGALVGAVVRRTLPAMATTLGVFVLVRIAVTDWVRPHLLAPLHTTMSLLDANRFGIGTFNGGALQIDAKGSGPPNSWTLSSHLLDSSGHVASTSQLSAFVHQYCPAIGPPPGVLPGQRVKGGPPDAAFQACREQAAKTFHLVVAYQPANRYWTFQWFELGLFLVLALLAAVGCYWWVTRHTG